MLAREVAAKIVFYGPGLSGKTTTLKKIHDSVKPAHRGEMMSLATEGDRTLFFDFLPVKVERVGDYAVRLALYTVPGQVFYNATRKLVLQGADGVVFVADSQPEAMDQNKQSLQNLEENLLEMGIRLDKFPLVIQWNKRDIPKSLPVATLRQLLNPRGVPDFETCATNGKGVLDSLKAITRLVIKDLRDKRVVPGPRPAAAVPSRTFTPSPTSAGFEDQIQQQLESAVPAPAPEDHVNAPRPPAPSAPAIPPMATRPAAAPPVAKPAPKVLGPAAALAPTELLDYAKAADSAYVSGDVLSCLRACQEGVRKVLAYAGEATAAHQAFLLRVDGADLLRLQGLGSREAPRTDDAAFAYYVLLQSLVRLAASGIPAASDSI